jgi:hypothetical protein
LIGTNFIEVAIRVSLDEQSKAWYEKNAKLETDQSIGAGKFLSDIFEVTNVPKPARGDNSGVKAPPASAEKLEPTNHESR